MSIDISIARGLVLPNIPFAEIAKVILGEKYTLSLAIVDAIEIRKINKQYRHKDEPTDILSFPLSESEGEIYICPEEVEKQMEKFDRNYENFFAFLFIHGCTHLKGYDHSDTMEALEAEYRRKFNI